jgi:hypothetical protein
MADEEERRRWERAAEAQRRPAGESLLGAVGGLRRSESTTRQEARVTEDDRRAESYADLSLGEERVPCVFLWVTGEPQAKVLELDSRVVVEEGDVVRERAAARLRPDDRVILGLGTTRWSPADEFTGAVIDAVQASHPGLVQTAKEWRRALKSLSDEQRLSVSQIRTRLASVGVHRETQTIEGWLDLQRASPIAPKGMRTEIAAIWPLIERCTACVLDEVSTACARLRALRTASGRALLQLWKGRAIDLGIDEAWLDELVDRLRQEVQVYETEAVTLGEVPATMLGWWIPAALASRFESDGSSAAPSPEDVGEEETGLS